MKTINNFIKIILIVSLMSSNNVKPNEITSITVDSPESLDAKVPKFLGLDNSFLKNTLIEDELKNYMQKVQNNNLDNKKIWTRRVWDIDFYKDKNLPVVVGTLKGKNEFSSKYQNSGLRFLDLPIHMPDQGWRIPKELEQFKEVIKMAVDHERICLPNFEKDHFVYITVDQGKVKPNTTQRRAGWHGDSYRKINTKQKKVNLLVDHVYVAYDNCPTLFVEGPFSFDNVDPENIDDVLKKFNEVAKNKNTITYPNYTLLKMDPYCVHDAGINDTAVEVDRTFVKISFSKIKYCHLGNAYNNLFRYNWPMTPRKNVPYTKEAIILSSHRKDRDKFIEIDPNEIDFVHKTSNVEWASSRVYSVIKNSKVFAQSAKLGEILESKNDNFIITINVAEQDDYKVTFSPGDSGFIKMNKFLENFLPDPNHKNWYYPKKIIRRAVQLTKDVRMKSSWGTMQYARAGDYLVYINETDIYFVTKNLFEEGFEVVD